MNKINLTEEDLVKTKITRVEVIDTNGRDYVNWDKNNKVQLSLQDDGRTLKIFINKEIV